MEKGDRQQLRDTGDVVIFEKWFKAPSGVLYASVTRERDGQLMAVPHFDLVPVGSPVKPLENPDMYM